MTTDLTPAQLWQAALGELQLQIARTTFDNWLRGTVFLSFENGVLEIGVENDYAKDWLENRLLSTIRRTVSGIAGRPIELRFVAMGGNEDESGEDDGDEGDGRDESRFDPSKWDASVWVERYNMPPILADESLDTLNWGAPALAKSPPSLREYLDNAPDYFDEGIGLTLLGATGVGKSHIATGLLKRACAEGRGAQFFDAGDLSDLLKQTYDRGGSDTGTMFPLRDVDLLALDDLRHTGPAWCMSKFEWILTHRYNRRLPTIVTSNLSLDEMHEAGLSGAVVDRLAYYSVVVTLSGPSYRAVRKREAIARIRAGAGKELSGIMLNTNRTLEGSHAEE